MFGYNRSTTTVPNGLHNLRTELVAKLNRASNSLVAYPLEAEALSKLAVSLQSEKQLTLDTIVVYAAKANVDFKSEMESVVRLSRI